MRKEKKGKTDSRFCGYVHICLLDGVGVVGISNVYESLRNIQTLCYYGRTIGYRVFSYSFSSNWTSRKRQRGKGTGAFCRYLTKCIDAINILYIYLNWDFISFVLKSKLCYCCIEWIINFIMLHLISLGERYQLAGRQINHIWFLNTKLSKCNLHRFMYTFLPNKKEGLISKRICPEVHWLYIFNVCSQDNFIISPNS